MFSALSWGQSQFDDAIEKATSEHRLAEDEDIALNLEICDQIRSKAVPPKDAARALRRRLAHRNPNVQLLTLALIDVCVKNGGDHFLVEVAGREFMGNMVSLLHANDQNPDVNARILRLVQNWATAFERKPALRYVTQVYRDLSRQSKFVFPPKDPALANSAMIDTSTAPEWIDSDVCMRCRTAFSFTNRKHHCRNCGQVFDQQCSTHTLPLPHFGITQEVRVCDSCFTRLSARREKKERSQSADFSSGHHRSRSHRHRDIVDPDLQRAIQLSLAESNSRPSPREPSYTNWQISEPPIVDRTSRPTPPVTADADEDDSELRAAIEASLREARAPRPSAPLAEPEPHSGHSSGHDSTYTVPPPLPVLPNHDLDPRESDAILTFSQSVQDEPTNGRRDLARVHALYDQATGLRPKLAMSLDDTGRKEQMLGEMHEKLSQAVRLYDQLLTEQLSRPTWKRPLGRANTVGSTSSPWLTTAPRAEQSYGAGGYRASHTQHNPPYTAQGPYTQHQKLHAEPNQPQPPDPYNPQQQPSDSYQHPHQPQLYNQPHQQPMLHPSQPTASEPHRQQSSEQFQQEAPEPYQQHAVYAASGPSYQQQPQQQSWSRSPYDMPPTPTPSHVYKQSQEYPGQQVSLGQLYEQQHSPPVPPVAHPPSFLQSPGLAPQQFSAPAPVQSSPTAPPQSYFQPVQVQPPVQVTQALYTPQSPSPAKATYQPLPPLAHSYLPTLARSSTLSATVPQTRMFPTVPTSNPQNFPLYGPGAPVSGLEQTEKKEATLIDL